MNNKPLIEIFSELKQSSEHRTAVEYFRHRTRADCTDEEIRKGILKRGSVDFDSPTYEGEEPSYKVEAYIHCYMGMHYQANLAVFRKLGRKLGFDNINDSRRILFIDYGCGPMTSGLALLECLGKRCASTEIAYRGIDISRRMCEKARQINAAYGLFSDAGFFCGIDDAVKDINRTILDDCTIIVNFSYVLSKQTFKTSKTNLDHLIDTIIDWTNKLSSSGIFYILYMNPEGNFHHDNWNKMKNGLRSECIKQMLVREGTCDYGYPKPVYYSIVEFKKRGFNSQMESPEQLSLVEFKKRGFNS